MTTAAEPADIVFLIDCDNTLLDNDSVEHDLRECLDQQFEPVTRDTYWNILEQLRREFGFTDYLGAVQRLRQTDISDPRLLALSSFLLNYPFASRVYPGALDVIRHLRTWGVTVILSDGDVILQPHKIQRAGLWTAVDGRVMISIHKEQVLDIVAARYPARHYVMIDDKLRVLTAMKNSWCDRVTTVFPCQGHYARDPSILAAYPAADLTVERIGDLIHCDLDTLFGTVTTRQLQKESR